MIHRRIQILCMPFFGLGRGLAFMYNSLFTFITYFELFWTLIIMNAVVIETNWYARALDSLGRACTGPNWKDLTINGLKAFMVMALNMGIKEHLLDERFFLSLL